MHKILRSVLAAALCVSAGVAHSDLLVKDYKKTKDQQGTKLYVLGVGNGMGWSNVMIKFKDTNAGLYCAPTNFVFVADNFINFVDAEIERRNLKDTDDTPIELILLSSLQRNFPCEKQ